MMVLLDLAGMLSQDSKDNSFSLEFYLIPGSEPLPSNIIHIKQIVNLTV